MSIDSYKTGMSEEGTGGTAASHRAGRTCLRAGSIVFLRLDSNHARFNFFPMNTILQHSGSFAGLDTRTQIQSTYSTEYMGANFHSFVYAIAV